MDLTMELFGLVMALFPVAFLAWYRRRPLVREAFENESPDVEAAARVHGRRAALLTVVCAAVIGGMIALGWNSTLTVCTGVVAFHVVWWTSVAPVLRTTERPLKGVPGLAAPEPAESPRRTASLVARRNADYLPAWWMAMPVAIFVGGVGVIVWRAVTGGIADPGVQLVAWIMPAGALGFLVGWGFWARAAVKSPQDLSGAVDPQALADAFDGFRRFLARGIYGIMTAAVLVFMGAAVVIVTTEGDAALQSELGAWIGGGGGAFVGVLGGLFGTLCSLKAMRLRRIRDEGVRGGAATPNPA